MANTKISGATLQGTFSPSWEIPIANGTSLATSAKAETLRQEIVNHQTGTVYTIANADFGKLITSSNTAAVTITLPQAGASSQFLSGWKADLENINTGTVTITPATSTIDGVPSLVVRQNQGVRIVSDGTNYNTVRGLSSVAQSSQLLTGTGNFTVPAGVFGVSFAMVGGGGGGGGVASGATATATSGVTGIFLTGRMIVNPGQVIAYACGAAGNGGAAGNNNGTAGGDTTFGSFTAKGGNAGTGSASGNAATLTSTQVVAAVNASAAIPTASAWLTSLVQLNNTNAGSAGVAIDGRGTWGVGGAGGNNSAGGNATGYGASGGGAGGTGGSSWAGGNGSAGAIIVWY